MDDTFNPRLADGALEAEGLPGRDLFIVARYLTPIDAQIACGCLVAAGMPAGVADDYHGQANNLVLPAMGGIRVLVPAQFMRQAEELLAAYERGDLAIDDDADVGPAA